MDKFAPYLLILQFSQEFRCLKFGSFSRFKISNLTWRNGKKFSKKAFDDRDLQKRINFFRVLRVFLTFF